MRSSLTGLNGHVPQTYITPSNLQRHLLGTGETPLTVVINVYSKSNNVLGTTKAAEAPARSHWSFLPRQNKRRRGKNECKNGGADTFAAAALGEGSDFIFRTAAERESNP